MQILNEHTLECTTIEYFQDMGYETAVKLSPDEPCPERASFSDVILKDRLLHALAVLNPNLSTDNINEVYRKLSYIDGISAVQRNRNFHEMLVNGVTVQYRDSENNIRHTQAKIIDFDNPENNHFYAVQQFIIKEKETKIPDIVVFINGLPIIVIELKNLGNENVNINNAYNQIQTYKNAIPSLFDYNELIVISDGINTRIGTITSNFERFTAWKTIDGESIASKHIEPLDVLIYGAFKKATLLQLIKNFTTFETDGENTYKKVAGYHQYYAVNKAINETERAVKESGDRKIGVMWHTQGSGKSLSMVFYASQLVQNINLQNPTIVVVTDRNDLDGQLFSTFANNMALIRTEPKQATSRAELRKLLENRESGGIIFTTIQKFAPEENKDTLPVLSNRKNIIIIADEAHRTQYGFDAKIKQSDDAAIIKFGYAKYMRDALPNASYIGFTGTPVELVGKNTKDIFGNYIDIYDMTRAVDDGTTVKIYYESRLVPLELSEELKDTINDEFHEITEYQEETEQEMLKSKWSRLEAIVGTSERIKTIAQDIITHFEDRQLAQEYDGGKAMIVCMSRRIAIEMYKAITAIKPDWHSDDTLKGKIKTVITGSSSDPNDWQPFIATKQTREQIAKRMKNVDDELQIAIVCDMWLTGFDVPSMHTMYIDKPLSGHNLMQAIARVNRVFKNKHGGLVVDYIGLAEHLKFALSKYTDNDRKNQNANANPEDAKNIFIEKLTVIKELLHNIDYSNFYTATHKEKYNIIMQVTDFVLGLDEEHKKLYVQSVTELTKAFSLCSSILSEKQQLDTTLHKHIKAIIVKRLDEANEKKTTSQLDAEINQLISKSISSGKVEDILQLAGVERPDISILSDEFMNEVRNIKHKNLAIELLKRLLKGNIKAMQRSNLVQAKNFSELLDQAIQKYLNRTVDATTVIIELIDMAHKFNDAQQRGEETGLTEEELAFYDALSMNASAKELMQDETLKIIAKEIAKTIKQNIQPDWTIRERIQAKMRSEVRRLLKFYKYPPDAEKGAIDIVLAQAKLMCENEVA